MKEYVTSYAECETTDHIKYTLPIEKHEEIVRCRDCRYYGCYDGSTWCSRTYEQVPGGICDYQTVEPDGFCKWGERNE